MTGRVVHRERLAWDAAQLFVRALGSRQVVGWLRAQVGQQFGPAYASALSGSFDRLWASQRPDAPQVEVGIWRVRLAELLAADGSLAEALRQLMAETSTRLDQASDIQVHGQVEQTDEPRVIDLDRFRT